MPRDGTGGGMASQWQQSKASQPFKPNPGMGGNPFAKPARSAPAPMGTPIRPTPMNGLGASPMTAGPAVRPAGMGAPPPRPAGTPSPLAQRADQYAGATRSPEQNMAMQQKYQQMKAQAQSRPQDPAELERMRGAMQAARANPGAIRSGVMPADAGRGLMGAIPEPPVAG